MAALTLAVWLLMESTKIRPTGDLLTATAQIGATLLVAYAIESSWLVRNSRVRNAPRENWLGFAVGIGLAGLTSVFVALGLAARIETGNWSWADDLALGFAVSGVLMVGALVAVFPCLIYEWSKVVQREGLEVDD